MCSPPLITGGEKSYHTIEDVTRDSARSRRAWELFHQDNVVVVVGRTSQWKAQVFMRIVLSLRESCPDPPASTSHLRAVIACLRLISRAWFTFAFQNCMRNVIWLLILLGGGVADWQLALSLSLSSRAVLADSRVKLDTSMTSKVNCQSASLIVDNRCLRYNWK